MSPASSEQKARYCRSDDGDGPSDDRGCRLIPFPQIKRRRFIMKTVARLVSVPAKTAEKLFAAALRQQTRAMTRKGIPAAVVERETRSLESAIRAELWRQVLFRPDDGVA
jgi:Family of unknown function (DUF6074)